MESVVPSPDFQTWRLVILATLSTVIIVSNTFCIAVLMRATDIKKVTRVLMVSMTVADLGMGVFTLPFKLLALIIHPDGSLMGDTFCAVHITLHTLLSGTSLLCVLLITVERYLAIEFPLRHRSLVTVRRSYQAVACAWMLCCANAAAAGSLAATTKIFHDEAGTCLSVSTQLNHHFEWFQICADVVIPLVLIVAIYTRILVLVGRHSVRHEIILLNSTCPATGAGPTPAQSGRLVCKNRVFAMRRKSLCTFLVVVLTYVLTFVPSAVIMILAISGLPVSDYAIEAARFSVYCYSWLNVVVYSLRNKVFREAAKSLFCGRR